jgi:hypothetical protein
MGIAAAIPADDPGVFAFEFHPQHGLSVRLRRGISHAAGGKLRGRTPFAFVIYGVRAQWGMRDALAHYYAIYPQIFRRRASAEGMWLWTGTDKVPNPRDYAYHEGVSPEDEALGILTFPYIIVGQREFVGISGTASTYQEQMELLDHAPLGDGSMGWGQDMREVIRACALHTPQGQLNTLVRQPKWVVLKNDDDSKWPRRLTFPLNPDPSLFDDLPEKKTVARATLQGIDQTLRERPDLDGIYIDSLNAWGAYLNFRTEHFRYADIPLTYDPATKLAAIDNQFSHLEFLNELGARLHAKGKLLFGNGINRGRVFCGFALDVMGCEAGILQVQKDNLSLYRFMRATAGQKPYLVLDNHEEHWLDDKLVRQYWITSTLYGIYPSFHNTYQRDRALYERHRPIIDLYLPIIRQLSAAGWEPITAARTDERVLMERFGPDAKGEVFLTLFNPSAQSVQASVKLDLDELAARAVTAVEEITQHRPLPAAPVFDIELPAGELRVIRVSLNRP